MNQLGRFARILDDREWDAVGEVFAEDVTFDYATGEDKAGIEALKAQFKLYLVGCGPTQHLLGSVILTFEGEEAVTRSYVRAIHQGLGDKSDRFLDSAGEYIDRWQLRGDRWLCVRRDARWFMNKGDFSVLLREGEKFVLHPSAEGKGLNWSVSAGK
jgi:hypothetical protein